MMNSEARKRKEEAMADQKMVTMTVEELLEQMVLSLGAMANALKKVLETLEGRSNESVEEA